MEKLSISVKKQNEKFQELSEKLDYYTITDPIYNSQHMNVIVKNKQQEFSKVLVDHFYNKEYLIEIYEGNYQAVKKSIIWILVWLSIFIVALIAILIVTFSYLEKPSLSMIPLFTLMILTVLVLFFAINIIRLSVIDKVINKEKEIDKKFVYLCIYKLNLEEKEDTSFFGLADECAKLKDDCH